MTLTKQTCAKQACDCCRIRRVKCDGKRPCSSCLQNSLDCTYLQPSRKRGPKSIRLRSLKRIAEVQRESGPNTIATAPVIYKRVPKKLIDQCLRLYHDNLYVIWPLLSYDDLHKLLEEKIQWQLRILVSDRFISGHPQWFANWNKIWRGSNFHGKTVI